MSLYTELRNCFSQNLDPQDATEPVHGLTLVSDDIVDEFDGYTQHRAVYRRGTEHVGIWYYSPCCGQSWEELPTPMVAKVTMVAETRQTPKVVLDEPDVEGGNLVAEYHPVQTQMSSVEGVIISSSSTTFSSNLHSDGGIVRISGQNP